MLNAPRSRRRAVGEAIMAVIGFLVRGAFIAGFVGAVAWFHVEFGGEPVGVWHGAMLAGLVIIWSRLG